MNALSKGNRGPNIKKSTGQPKRMDEGGQPSTSSKSGPSKSALHKKVKRLEREQRRLRSSVSFQLGVHLTRAVRQPWRLLVLPLTFPSLAFRLGMQRLGKRPLTSASAVQKEDTGERNHCIVLFPTNGVGFGHFTRMYAVARALRKADPELEIVFFTPMPTLHVLYNEGFPTYHLAGRYMHKDMSATQWNGLVEDMLHLIFDTHRPKWFMFDGAFPYRGMLNAIASQPSMEKWWMKRGSLKASKSVPVDSAAFFDGIIVPSEGKDIELGEGEHLVPPLRAVGFDEAWDRDFARSRLSVPEEAKAVYVQLGAGRINDIESDLNTVLEALFEHEDVVVVLGESMLGQRLSFTHERLRVIRDYPNALYAKAFDASVQAGGYNSFQEMRMFGIPTLFIPNTETGMDDQVKRCKMAEEEGWGLVHMSSGPSVKERLAALLTMEASPRASENGVGEVLKLLSLDEA
jgi:UDP-N-acetylglucosamine--N-acetylmuramyl-(pentapeptide) pyrophosphoryl-undecaprenol N-acetylglucosamine transferase